MKWLFTFLLSLMLLLALWLPTYFTAYKMKQNRRENSFRRLWLYLSMQLLVAVALCLLADFIGLRNPAGYVLAICFVVRVSGAGIYWNFSRIAK